MEVVNNLGKDFFKLLKRNFPATEPLYNISNEHSIKLSCSCMPNINNIINRSNIMKLNKEKHKETPKYNCKDKAGCPLKGKCQQEYVVYKVEVYSGEPCSSKNRKKYIFVPHREF